MSDDAYPPKPTRCAKCGTASRAIHWSNAAHAWVCLDCHLRVTP